MAVHALRDYQLEGKHGVYAQWHAGCRTCMLVLPTGAGKTVVFANILAEFTGAACAVAHRAELVVQMSVALAREGVRHRVIGPSNLQRACSSAHLDRLKRDYIDPNGRVAVASIDTLIGMEPTTPWLHQVGLWIMDEAHHVLAENKWGQGCLLFPNAYGLGVTATPIRADGKGLGRHADGLMDAMVVGPTMRELIERGFLTEYRVFAPPSDIDLSQVPVTGSGDYSPIKLRGARRRSHITGDVVQHYLRIAKGKLGVTFDTDIESATDTAQAYRDAGVPAQVVTSKTPDHVRSSILRRFEAREVLQLVNVDLFGEGFDLPAIEVVSMARPTQSYSLYCQQFGRALRPLEGKTHAIIIDHVGNVIRHGLPDARREWTLDRRERRSRNAPTDVIPVRSCTNPACVAVYERVLVACPYCGTVPPIVGRSSPEQVDGDLAELDPAVLAALRGERDRIDRPVVFPQGLPLAARGNLVRTHEERQQAQNSLRKTMSLWGGWNHSLERSQAEGHRRFFYAFGIDVMTAQTLNSEKARELETRIREDLARNNVVEAL
jgi:superfamily II DNA or RNA helicase